MHLCIFLVKQCSTKIDVRVRKNYLSPSHAAIKISINATAAEFISKNIFPTPMQVKKNIKNKISR